MPPPSRQHARKALLGITGALILGLCPAVGMYFDTRRQRVVIWILLLLATLPVLAWGVSHLARHRGYSTAGGCGLCIVGYLVSGFVGSTSPYPLAFAIGIIFMVILPTLVLFAMPDKSDRSKRHRRH
jgi:hypothetical protein